MQRKKTSAGSTTVAVTLLVFLLFFTAITVYLFVKKTWWFPEPITAFGRDIDRQFMRTLVITGIVFVLSQVALGWLVFRYRDRGGRASFSHGNNTMEFLWTLATFVLFVGLGVYAKQSWGQVHFVGAGPGAVQIEVLGQQFAWYFRYPGSDGMFGRTDPQLVRDAAQNFFGIDANDPAAKDDLVVPVMAVPVNREVELILRGKDVTHSFFVRELRLKQDAVPGLMVRVHFTAMQVGQYEIACAELCGMSHHRMRSFLTVMSDDDFQKWLREQAAAASE